MFKFFRKIRQKVIAEGSIRRYLIYSLGEILLVVVGILIALQINAWYSKRVSKNQMAELFQSMQKDLRQDTFLFNERIKFVKEFVRFKEKMLSLSNYDKVSTDSLFVFIAARYSEYEINSTTFDKIKNLGISLEASDKSLANAIDIYYTNSTEDLKGFIEWDLESASTNQQFWFYGQDQFELALNPFYIQNPKITLFQDSIENRQRLIEQISMPKGRNLLKMEYVTKMALLEHYHKIKTEAIQLIQGIEKELN